MNEGQTVCAACGMHGQKCTFVEDPRPRKRRVDGDGQAQEAAKRRCVKNAKLEYSHNVDYHEQGCTLTKHERSQ